MAGRGWVDWLAFRLVLSKRRLVVTTFIICLVCYALGLITMVISFYMAVRTIVEKEWFVMMIAFFLFFAGLAVFGVSYASYEDGHRNAIRWNEEDLVLGQIYELCGKQTPFEFTRRSALKLPPTTETRQLTWLKQEGEENPFPFGLSQKLTGGKHFVFFRSNKDDNIDFSILPDSSSPIAGETVDLEKSP